MNLKEATEQVGRLGRAGKMPCPTYNTPAKRCITGARLRKVVGSTCHGCYAFKGNYLYPSVQQGLEKRFKAFKKTAIIIQKNLDILDGLILVTWQTCKC